MNIWLIILLLGFPQISETIYTPSLPQMTHDLHTSPHLTELTLSLYFMGFAIGVFIWGSFCDLIGRRKSMLLGLLLYTVACLVLWCSTTIESLLFWRVVQALGASAGSVVTQTMLRDLYEGKKRHQIFALVSGALAFVPAVGPVIGSILAAHCGWNSSFLFLTLLGIWLFACCLAKLPETRPMYKVGNKPAFKAVAKQMLSDRYIFLHVLLISLCNGIIFGFYGEAPFLFINLMQIPLELYGFFGLVLCAAGLLASFLSHRLNDRFSPLQIIFGASMSALLGSVVLCAAAFADFFQPNYTLFEIGTIIFGIALCFLGVGLTLSNSLSMALNDYKAALGMAGSLFGLFYYVGITLFMALISLLHNGGPYLLPLFFLSYSGGMLLCARKLLLRQCAEVIIK